MDERRRRRGLTQENLPVSLKGLTGKVLGKGVGEHVVRRAVVDLDNTIGDSFAERHHTEIDK